MKNSIGVSNWHLLLGIAIGLVINLSLVPWATAQRMGATQLHASVAAAALGVGEASGIDPTQAMKDSFAMLWGIDYDPNDSALANGDGNGLYFYGVSRAESQSQGTLSSSWQCRLTPFYSEQIQSGATGIDPGIANQLGTSGLSSTTTVVAAELQSPLGFPFFVVALVVTIADSQGNQSQALHVLAVEESAESAEKVAKDVPRIYRGETPQNEYPVGADGMPISTDCHLYPADRIVPSTGQVDPAWTQAGCESYCNCKFNECASNARADHSFNVQALELAAIVDLAGLVAGLALCGPNPICIAVVLALVAVIMVVLVMLLLLENKKLESAIARCESDRRGCLAAKCNIFIYSM